MIAIKKEQDETITIEGLNESDFMCLFMIVDTVFFGVKPKPELSEEASNLLILMEDYYEKQNGKKIKYLH